MQHHPESVFLVEAKLDEVVAGAERTEMAERPRMTRLGMLFQDLRVAVLEPIPGCTNRRRRLPVPGTRVIAAAMIGAAVRHRRLDLRAHSAEAIG